MRQASAKTISALYDARAAIPFDGSTYRRSIELDIGIPVVNGLDRSAFICDVGCGQGWHLETFAELGFTHLSGIDLSAASIQQFMRRSGVARSGRVQLVHGDVRKWGVRGFFDAATSFLSCLGTYTPRGDISYLRALRRIVRRGGTVVVTCFSREAGPQLSSNTRSVYSKSNSAVTTTHVTLDPNASSLTIAQKSGGRTLPSEIIRLYTRSELLGLAKSAGMHRISVQPRSPEDRADPITLLIGHVP
jgi:SAM-dependent methyltransferase